MSSENPPEVAPPADLSGRGGGTGRPWPNDTWQWNEVFVGRRRELDLMRSAAERAQAGLAQVVVVEGAAGIGKSALLRCLVRETRFPTQLRASGDEGEASLSFGVVEQLLATAKAASPSDAALAGALSGGWPDPATAGATLLQVLGVLQGRGPVAVFVDDLHWADVASASALRFACRRLDADHVLVVTTTRPAEAGEPGERWGRLSTASPVVTVRLEGLSQTEVELLSTAMGRSLSAGASRQLWQHTLGNPLYTRALLHEIDPDILDDHYRSSSVLPLLPAPRTLADSVLVQVARCSAQSQALIKAAAVLGEREPLATAMAVAGVSDLAIAIDGAVSSGLLDDRVLSGVRSLSFAHPLVRAAVYDDLAPSRRSELHLRAAAVVGGAAGLAHRVAAAVGPDEPLAAEIEAAADIERAGGGFARMGNLLLEAASISEGAGRERRLLGAIEALIAAGDLRTARGAGGQLDTLPASARRSWAVGYLAYLQGSFFDAQQLLADAWDRQAREAADSHLRATIASLLALLAITAGQRDQALVWSRRAWEAGASDSLAAGLVLNARAVSLAIGGQSDEALLLLEPIGPPATADAGLLDAVMGRGMIQTWTGKLAGATADLQAVLFRARTGSGLRSKTVAAASLSAALYQAGELAEAVVYADLAGALEADEAVPGYKTIVYGNAAFAQSARGEFSEAHSSIRVALAGARESGLAGDRHRAGAAMALLAAVEGDAKGLVAAADLLRDLTEAGVYPIGPIQAEALLAQGRLADASAMLGDYEASVSRADLPFPVVAAARVRINLCAALGDPGSARTAFEAALALGDDRGFRLEVARLRLAYGMALRNFGERRVGTRMLIEAADALGELEAWGYKAHADRALGRTGTEAYKSATATVRLSARESSIASLVASGLGNKEVAARLFVSPKTVEYHLSNVFAKLGVGSRAQLAAKLADVGSAANRAGPQG